MIVVKQPVRRALAVAALVLLGWVPLARFGCQARYQQSEAFVRDRAAAASTWLGMPVELGPFHYEQGAEAPFAFEQAALLDPGDRRPTLVCNALRVNELDAPRVLQVSGLSFEADDLDAALERVVRLLRRLPWQDQETRLTLSGDGAIRIGAQTLVASRLRAEVAGSRSTPTRLELTLELQDQGAAPLHVSVACARSDRDPTTVELRSETAPLPARVAGMLLPLAEWLGPQGRAAGRLTLVRRRHQGQWRFAGRLTDVDLGVLAGRLLGASTDRIRARAQVDVASLQVGPAGLEQLTAEVDAPHGSIDAVRLATLARRYGCLLTQSLPARGPVPFDRLAMHVAFKPGQLTLTGAKGSDTILSNARGPLLRPPLHPVALARPTAVAPTGPAGGLSPAGWLGPLLKGVAPTPAIVWDLLTMQGAAEALTTDLLIELAVGAEALRRQAQSTQPASSGPKDQPPAASR